MRLNRFSEDQIHKLFKKLEKDFELISPDLKNWNSNYFKNHKNRYINDLKLVKHFYDGGTILEIGSIPCHFTYCLKKLGYQVISIDIAPERASSFIANADLDVRKCDIEQQKIPFEDNSFSLILFNEIFEHLRLDPISTLKEIFRLLKPGGTIILETPNLYSLLNILKFNLGFGINDAFTEFNKLHTIGHMGHVREYSTKEMKKFLGNTGFRVIDVKYVHNISGVKKSFLKKIFHYTLRLLYLLIPKIRTHQILICRK